MFEKLFNEINLESGNLSGYKGFMADKNIKRDALVGAMLPDTIKRELQSIADNEDRSLSYVASAFILRGLAAYQRDGQLKETQMATKPQSSVEADVVKGYQPHKKNNKKTA